MVGKDWEGVWGLTRATTAVQPAEGPLYERLGCTVGSAFSMESACTGMSTAPVCVCMYVCACMCACVCAADAPANQLGDVKQVTQAMRLLTCRDAFEWLNTE